MVTILCWGGVGCKSGLLVHTLWDRLVGSLSAGHGAGREHWLLPRSESCKASLEETGSRPEIICLQTAPRGELASAARRTNRQHFSVCSTNISPVLARGQTSTTGMSLEWPNLPQWTFKEQFSFVCHLRAGPFSIAGASALLESS